MARAAKPKIRKSTASEVFIKDIISGSEVFLKHKLDGITIHSPSFVQTGITYKIDMTPWDIDRGQFVTNRRFVTLLPHNELFVPKDVHIFRFKSTVEGLYCWIDVASDKTKVLTRMYEQFETEIKTIKLMYY